MPIYGLVRESVEGNLLSDSIYRLRGVSPMDPSFAYARACLAVSFRIKFVYLSSKGGSSLCCSSSGLGVSLRGCAKSLCAKPAGYRRKDSLRIRDRKLHCAGGYL